MKRRVKENLKAKSGRELHDASCGGTVDMTEGGAKIADVAIYGSGAVELRVIESVEGFDA